jgi:hypothetical protein
MVGTWEHTMILSMESTFFRNHIVYVHVHVHIFCINE